MPANNTPTIQYLQSGGNSFTENKNSPNYLGQLVNANDPFPSLPSPNEGITFPGSTQIVLSSREVSYSATTLGSTNHTYSSPNYLDIQGLARYFADWGAAYNIKEGPTHTITVSIPWDTITEEDFFVSIYASEQFELVPNSGVKNLLYSGINIDSFVSPTISDNHVILPVAVQGAIQSALTNNQPGFLIPTSSASSSYASYSAVANQTFQYLRAGIEGVPSYTQTLKRTAVIDERNKAGAFQTAIDDYTRTMQTSGSYNFVMSTPDMLKNYAIPADTVAQFMLPSYSKTYGIIGLDPYSYNVYAGWLIKPAILQFIGRNKVQITQEFVWDEWAQGLYFIRSSRSDFPLIYSVNTGS